MYKAVFNRSLCHAYDRESEMALMKKAISSSGTTTSSNSTGNRYHNKKDGKFTFNPNKAANVSKAISVGARNASQNIANNSNSYLRGKKGPRADLSKYDDRELQRILNRERMEREYDSYFNTPVESKGKKFVDGLSTVLGITATAAGIAAAGFTIIQQLKRSDV